MKIYNFLLALIPGQVRPYAAFPFMPHWLICPFGPICCGSFHDATGIFAKFLRFAICTNYANVLAYFFYSFTIWRHSCGINIAFSRISYSIRVTLGRLRDEVYKIVCLLSLKKEI